MGTITINGKKVEFTDEKNVLTIIRKAGFEVPTLCYQPELSIFGACRLCMVEDDRGRFFASCSEEPRDGMVIYTNTPRLMRYRRTILELLLAAHDRDCTTCVKSGECHLLELAHRMGVDRIRFKNREAKYPIDESSPAIVRNPNKCILCGDCVRMCDNVQSVNAIDFAYRGTSTLVTPAFNKTIAQTNCVNCGQCRVVCPTGAISIKTNIDEVWDALADPNTIVVAQVAPAVRVALGDKFGIPKGENVMGKLVNALHRLGFHEVYDTTYGADLTVIEEAEELLERISSGAKGPLFTSCCPAWVKFCETRYPELADNISTCRSPMEMFGSVIKEYFGNCGKRVVSVAIMPCTAKKFEAMRDEFRDKNGTPYVDYVITSQEIIQMIRQSGIRFDELEPEAVSMPFGMSSGAGLIFGASGGVTEAVLRRLSDDKSAGAIRSIANSGVRDIAGLKECSITHNGEEIKIAIVSGLENTDKLIHRIEEGEVSYHMVEVMACPGGCAGCVSGAGQPFAKSGERRQRSESLYRNDRMCLIRRSEENPLMEELYSGILKDRTHELLHVDYVK